MEDRLVTDVGGHDRRAGAVYARDDRGDGAQLGGPLLRESARRQGDGWFEVCVKHVAAAAEGASCQVRSTLREVVDGRKLRFDVEVREGERTIGVGTHERRVIEVGAVKSS